MTTTIKRQTKLGYEVGTGKEVSIPLGHMIVTGQTQAAGKTTALEAIISRAGVTAVAFITKRGEGRFGDATQIQPYFREKVDWEFVSSILEARMHEKMKFERAWIVRACKGCRTLRAVRAQLRTLMDKAKGMNHDIYMLLAEYLDMIIPELEDLPYSDTLQLKEGALNVIDLNKYSTPLQMLVIRAVMEEIYENRNDTITIVPEAWEMVPNGRNTPVKMAAAQLIRKGAGLGNFMWLDSQDLAGVDTEIRRSMRVWLLGVQREANEVKRTLAHVPSNIAKPKPDALMTLKKGQFFLCEGSRVIQVYVQPEWMESDAIAIRVATGQEDVEDLSPWAPHRRSDPSPPWANQGKPEAQNTNQVTPPPQPSSPPAPPPKEDDMDDKTAHKLIGAIEELSQGTKALTSRLDGTKPQPRPSESPATPNHAGSIKVEVVDDRTFSLLKDRILEDPQILGRLSLTRPTILVDVQPQIINYDSKKLEGQVALMISEGFFKSPRGNMEIHAELKSRGIRYDNRTFGLRMSEITEAGFLRRNDEQYQQAPGLNVTRDNVSTKGGRTSIAQS